MREKEKREKKITFDQILINFDPHQLGLLFPESSNSLDDSKACMTGKEENYLPKHFFTHAC